MKKYILVATAALTLAACNNENEPVQGTTQDGRVPLQVTSGIQTRAYDNQWESGDKIGIYAFADETAEYTNIPYTTSTGGASGSFSPVSTTIYLPADYSEYSLVAYYPQTDDLQDDTYTVDLTDQTDLAAIDLMAADVQTASRSNPSVAFSFVHKLSKVEIYLEPGAGMADADLKGITVQLTNQQTSATFDVTQPAEAVTVNTSPSTATLTLNTLADGTYSEGIVMPNTGFTDMAFQLTLADNTSFSWDLNESTATQFEAGKKYVYNITVNHTSISVTSATITNWETGNGAEGEDIILY